MMGSDGFSRSPEPGMREEEGNNVEVPRETILTLVILYRVLVYPM
jgi:hypothetical protein